MSPAGSPAATCPSPDSLSRATVTTTRPSSWRPRTTSANGVPLGATSSASRVMSFRSEPPAITTCSPALRAASRTASAWGSTGSSGRPSAGPDASSLRVRRLRRASACRTRASAISSCRSRSALRTRIPEWARKVPRVALNAAGPYRAAFGDPARTASAASLASCVTRRVAAAPARLPVLAWDAYSWAGVTRSGGRVPAGQGRLVRPSRQMSSCRASNAAALDTASVSWVPRSTPSSTSASGVWPTPCAAALPAARTSSMPDLPNRCLRKARKRGFSRSSVTPAVTMREVGGRRSERPARAPAAPAASNRMPAAVTRTSPGSPGWETSGASGSAPSSRPKRAASSMARSVTRSVAVSSAAVTTRRDSPSSQYARRTSGCSSSSPASLRARAAASPSEGRSARWTRCPAFQWCPPVRALRATLRTRRVVS